MEENTYRVFIHYKIPLLTKGFYFLFIACVILLFIFGIYLLPSTSSSDDVRAAYLVLTTSEFEKLLFVIGLLGSPTFYFLYKYIRIKQKGLLTLLPGKIQIDNFKTRTDYPINEITHITCNDALTSDGFPKGKLAVVLKDKVGKATCITLTDYSQSEELMNRLLDYENIRIDVTNFSSNPEVLDL